MNPYSLADSLEEKRNSDAELNEIWIENRKAEIVAECKTRSPLETSEGYSLREAIREEIDSLDLDLSMLLLADDPSVIAIRHEQAKIGMQKALDEYARRIAEFELEKLADAIEDAA